MGRLSWSAFNSAETLAQGLVARAFVSLLLQQLLLPWATLPLLPAARNSPPVCALGCAPYRRAVSRVPLVSFLVVNSPSAASTSFPSIFQLQDPAWLSWSIPWPGHSTPWLSCSCPMAARGTSVAAPATHGGLSPEIWAVSLGVSGCSGWGGLSPLPRLAGAVDAARLGVRVLSLSTVFQASLEAAPSPALVFCCKANGHDVPAPFPRVSSSTAALLAQRKRFS